MTDKVPSQATFWGIRKPEIRVLLVITSWFNGRPVTIRGEKRKLATHHEPSLEGLFRASQWDYESHADAHQRLLNNDLLQEEYVARRKIDWSPTEQGRQAIRDCLKPWGDYVRPEWADERDSGPLYGDPNEGLLHRKGVEIAGTVLPWMAWAFDIEHPSEPYGVEWYPNDNRGEACHDLHVDTNEWMDDVGVEVITSSNNLDHLVSKWSRYQDEDRLTFWIFDTRETACQLWNALDSRSHFYLDGRFNHHSNWSAKAINRKIWRSSDKYREEPAGDLVHTVTGLLEGDRDTIQELFEEYHSKN
ncbi:hypothetical protein ACFQJ5_05655 [Halomicroarcula sp. GCM10025324]|uniref:hypothetical protein n=1 Tax=Haloarcula TaxID=2237 RepID=UPI0023E8CD78|nr:hypothetical protein [Halomicroarcula sp. ZS-22-S1]